MKKGYFVLISVLSVFVLCFCANNVFAHSKKIKSNKNVNAQKNGPVFQTEFVFEATVTISDMMVIGPSKYGVRRLVPITGGTFEGPNISGVVVPGGADWQTVRADGDTELYARYTLETDDGVLIQVINRVLMHTPPEVLEMIAAGEPVDLSLLYTRCVLEFEAPTQSPYEFLNHAVYIGTLTLPEDQSTPAVIIRAYKLL